MPDEYIKKANAIAALRKLLELSNEDRARAIGAISRIKGIEGGLNERNSS